MNRADITKMNKARREMGLKLIDIEPGEMFNGFDTPDECKAVALAVWTALKAEGDSLTYSHNASEWCSTHGTLIGGPEGNEFDYGVGRRGRKLTAVVKRVQGEWKFDRIED